MKDDWQPIETAPRDGTIILLSDGVFVHAGCWAPSVCGDDFPWVFMEDISQHQPGGCCDNEDAERIRVNAWMAAAPTDWRPLPAPPQGDTR